MSNLEIIQNAYASFGEGDIPAVLDVLDPEVEWIEREIPGAPHGGTHRGPQAVAENVFGVLPALYQKFELIPEEWVDGGDDVVMVGRLTVAGKGGEQTMRIAQLWKLRDGKVVRFETFQDTLKGAQALGGT